MPEPKLNFFFQFLALGQYCLVTAVFEPLGYVE